MKPLKKQDLVGHFMKLEFSMINQFIVMVSLNLFGLTKKQMKMAKFILLDITSLKKYQPLI
jgi:hypothetical protein